jgi:hypothetical protein
MRPSDLKMLSKIESRDALIVTFALWNFTLDPRDLACFLTPFDVHVEQVKVPAFTCCGSISDGKAHTTSCKVIRESSWTLGKEEAPLPIIRATLAILAPLDGTFVAIVRRSGNPNKE